MENFVILVLCGSATFDDLLHEKRRRKAVAIDILNYDAQIDYNNYKSERLKGNAPENPVHLMFVFGRNDSIIVKSDEDFRFLNTRLEQLP